MIILEQMGSGPDRAVRMTVAATSDGGRIDGVTVVLPLEQAFYLASWIGSCESNHNPAPTVIRKRV